MSSPQSSAPQRPLLPRLQSSTSTPLQATFRNFSLSPFPLINTEPSPHKAPEQNHHIVVISIVNRAVEVVLRPCVHISSRCSRTDTPSARQPTSALFAESIISASAPSSKSNTFAGEEISGEVGIELRYLPVSSNCSTKELRLEALAVFAWIKALPFLSDCSTQPTHELPRMS